MKGSEVHANPDPEVVELVGNKRQELFNLRFQHATGQLIRTQTTCSPGRTSLIRSRPMERFGLRKPRAGTGERARKIVEDFSGLRLDPLGQWPVIVVRIGCELPSDKKPTIGLNHVAVGAHRLRRVGDHMKDKSSHSGTSYVSLCWERIETNQPAARTTQRIGVGLKRVARIVHLRTVRKHSECVVLSAKVDIAAGLRDAVDDRHAAVGIDPHSA